jgi:hypothetical protein
MTQKSGAAQSVSSGVCIITGQNVGRGFGTWIPGPAAGNLASKPSARPDRRASDPRQNPRHFGSIGSVLQSSTYLLTVVNIKVYS